jgi:penicillin amidase
MAEIQSDVQLLDAQVLTPHILQAFAAARRPDAPANLAAFAGDAAVGEAVDRLADWDFSTPTGIDEGFDAADKDGDRKRAKQKEVAKSVAATIYSVWRGQVLRNTIDGTLQRVGLGPLLPGGENSMIALRNLLDSFAVNRGRGASGLNFFDVRTVDLPPEVERDIILLQSLKDALNLLASPAFGPAFAGSTNQDDYRWGKLHRIVFSHPLNVAPFAIPPMAGFADLTAGLPGIATDGGFDTVDSASHIARAATLNGFMFNGGPSRRFIGEARAGKIKAVQIIPGGESGVPGTLFFGNLLGSWLTNDYHEALTNNAKLNRNMFTEEVFDPVN